MGWLCKGTNQSPCTTPITQLKRAEDAASSFRDPSRNTAPGGICNDSIRSQQTKCVMLMECRARHVGIEHVHTNHIVREKHVPWRVAIFIASAIFTSLLLFRVLEVFEVMWDHHGFNTLRSSSDEDSLKRVGFSVPSLRLVPASSPWHPRLPAASLPHAGGESQFPSRSLEPASAFFVVPL